MRRRNIPAYIKLFEGKIRREKDRGLKKLYLETLRRLFEEEFPPRPPKGNGNDMKDHNATPLAIFISHSSADVKIAESLIELFQIALTIPDNRIRCTSVEGYMLDAGVSVVDQLREEIHGAEAFIGLISPDSLASTYVLFELGARWGAKRHLMPLLVSATDKALLRDPLKGLNALACDRPAQVHQLIANLSTALKLKPGGAAAYGKYVTALVNRAKKSTKARKP